MEAETLIIQTHQEEVVCEQTSEQVMATGTGEIKVALAEPFCKTEIIERGGVGNSQHDEVKEENSSPARLYLNPDSLVYMKNGPAVGIAMSATEEVREVYLKNVFMMPPDHEFYCPKCKDCINKVLFCTTRQEIAVDEPLKLLKGPAIDPLVTKDPKVTKPQVPKPPVTTVPPVTGAHQDIDHHDEDIECLVRCSTCFSLLIQKGKDFFTGLVSRDPQGPQGLGSGTGDSIIHLNPPTMPRDPAPIIPISESTGWEILKSIVYGGLAELLASLSVVTSAASADATTLSIVALAIANLIGGLSVLGHNLRDLKASQPREQGSEAHAQEDKYYELLGKRENFYLHTFFAILSFLIFGLVPPTAYGFSFRESDDKDLKLAAVAIASLICITLLGIAKAHIQRSKTFMAYFKTVAFYVTSGVLASLLTYEAGAMMKKLVEQLGWFEPKPNFGLALHEMSIEKSGWGSY